MEKFLKISSVLAIIIGAILVMGGIWGIMFTYKNVAQEDIVTTPDSSIPNKPVRGPLTLMAQAEIIREHTLKITNGKTFAEMPREVPQLNSNGRPVLSASGTPVMTPNTARNIWITSTTLMTALNMAILSYAFSSVVILLGFILIWLGFAFRFLSKNKIG